MKYVVNFFAEQVIDYGKLIEQQAKVTAPDAYYRNKQK